MHPNSWIEPLLEKALSYYLSSRTAGSFIKDPKEFPKFKILHELSNLRICLSASQHLFLSEFRSAESRVEAILADSSSRIETVFSIEAVQLWQTKTRSQLTTSPTGSLFHILKSELRVSDCFLPPKVELWVDSFEIVGGLGNDVPQLLREVGSSTATHRLLQLYAESHEPKRANDVEVAMMNSPLQSQESSCSLKRSCDEKEDTRNPEELENSETCDGSQPFLTQISQPSTPKVKRQPLTPKQPRVHQDSKSQEVANKQDVSSFRWITTGQQVAMCPAEDPTDTVGSALEEAVTTFRDHKAFHKSVPLSRNNTAPIDISPSLHGCHWPGGRTPLLNGRYLPRYLTKVRKDQQEILETPNAWQPSKADRRIRGSIPIQVLNSFSELVDKAPEIGSDGTTIQQKEPSNTEKLSEDMELAGGGHNDTPNAVSERSSSPLLTNVSWSPTQSPAPSEPALPENSSPLRAPPRRAPLSPKRSDRNSSADDASRQELLVNNGLAMPSEIDANASNFQQAGERDDILLCKRMPSPPVYTAPDTAVPDEDRRNVDLISLNQHCIFPDPKVAQAQETDPLEEYLSPSKSGKASSQQTGLITVAPQTQKDLRYEEAGDNALIQVHRTPFISQPATLGNMARSFREQAISPNVNTDGSLTKDRGPRSPPSVVPGTFMDGQPQRRRRTQAASSRSPQDELDSAEDQQTGEVGGSKMAHISKSVEATDAASESYPSSPDKILSQSAGRARQRPFAKRKHCSDHYARSQIQPCAPTAGRSSVSIHARSKRPRMALAFPSLDALKDFNTGQTPSEIARESRRTFFHNKHNTSNTSSLSTLTPLRDRWNKAEESASSRGTDCEMSHSQPPRQTAPRISLFPGAHLKLETDAGSSSRSPSKGQNLYEMYRMSYPEYKGDAVQFHKGCKQIRELHEKGKAPHSSLWDDFIFRRHHDYRDYLLQVTQACEDALPYLQYYTEQVERPLRMQLVVRPAHLLSLKAASFLGSSVQSPAAAAPADGNSLEDPEKSVAASSSISNVQSARQMAFATNASQCRSQRDVEHAVDLEQPGKINEAQESCVERWVQLQSVDKELGAESPELGIPDVTIGESDIPRQDLSDAGEVPASPTLGLSAAVSCSKETASVWCDDPNTPFKNFARSHMALASEKKQLKEAVHVDQRGCLKPHLQNVIEIFTFYRK